MTPKEEQLKHLKEIYEMTNKKYASIEDVAKIVVEVGKVLRENNQANDKKIEDLIGLVEDKLKETIQESKEDSQKNQELVNNTKKEFNKLISDLSKEITASISDIKKLIPEGVNLKPITDKLVSFEQDILKLSNNKNYDDLSGGFKSFKQSLVREIKEELDQIKKSIKEVKEIKQPQPLPSKMTGMRKIPIVKRYRLTDQCDGSTKSFTLPLDTTDVLGVFGTQFPVNFDPYNSSGGDWSFEGRTLTLGDSVEAPESGQTLWALIETLFY